MKKSVVFWFLAGIIVWSVSCSKDEDPVIIPDNNNDTTPATVYESHEEWSYNLGVYEVNIRQYTSSGTFDALAAQLPRLKAMGVGILWLMPINPIGEENRIGSLGSYYSVQDYLNVNPEYGTLSDFKDLVDEIHEQDMFVIIDWVANHTSWDNVLTETNPEYYNTDVNGDFQPPPGTNWTDVIDLDFTNTGLRNYMIDAMKFWVEEYNVDGFRCDAVDFVPMDFWEEAIAVLKEADPGIIMLAEGADVDYHYAGFDMTFQWNLHAFESGVMHEIYTGARNASSLGTVLTNELNNYPDEAYRVCFTQNHDVNSWHGTEVELFGEATEVFNVLTHTLIGTPLLYSGQESGLDKKLAFFEHDPIDWGSYENEAFYTTLLNLKRNNEALWNGLAGGQASRITTSNGADIFAYMRKKEGDRVVAVMNLSEETQTFTLDGDAFAGMYSDVFSGSEVTLEAEQELTLDAWDYMLLEINAE